MELQLIQHLNSLNSDIIEMVLLLLEPCQLKPSIRSSIKVGSLFQNEAFRSRYDQVQYGTLLEEYPPGTKAGLTGAKIVGALGSERLFYCYFDAIINDDFSKQVDQRVGLIGIVLMSAIRQGSPRFAFWLLNFLQHYYDYSIDNILMSYPIDSRNLTKYTLERKRDNIVIRMKGIIVEGLASRGDLQSAITLQEEYKVDKDWVVLGMILGGQENFVQQARQLGYPIRLYTRDFRAAKNAVDSGNFKMIDILISLRYQYSNLEDITSEIGIELIEHNQWEHFLDIRCSFPFEIKTYHLIAAITVGNLSYLSKLLDEFRVDTCRLSSLLAVIRSSLINDDAYNKGPLKEDLRFFRLVVAKFRSRLVEIITYLLSEGIYFDPVTKYFITYSLDQQLISEESVSYLINVQRAKSYFPRRDSLEWIEMLINREEPGMLLSIFG